MKEIAMDYLPNVYKGFGEKFPGIKEAYDALAVRCNESGPLDRRSRRLVKLGVAIGLGSEGGVRSHARRALEEGVPAAELRHAVLMAITSAGFPAMIAAMHWVEEVIEKSGQAD
ncbi:MAG: carboxymuconolactone decarboxylase family protein [Dehalococcoidia bacterium]|nr:carboxymuconolactone decarboxylase family protein [Dehalococcoidia bacterium]